MLTILKSNCIHILYSDRYARKPGRKIKFEKDIPVMVFRDVEWGMGCVYAVKVNGRRRILNAQAWIDVESNEPVGKAFQTNSSIALKSDQYTFDHFAGTDDQIEYDFPYARITYINHKLLLPDGNIFFTQPIYESEFDGLFQPID